ncbi:amino acid adenylation domain-containing protein [Streptomyces sp. WI04-05B]|uniref:amino acid adenylation domain-containing protein n=2 Tax=Streptomyces TaxID=1883 RepID=UPI0029ADB965|nr:MULTISPECIES: amino acid adenylation domain-containing protein [unclassified Streptomyces]MDX2545245.1 amino acid adenylation domain-containing protein [Streptomyces sp. WI04-05B]MDX2587359.1 amino acid adenylation domain-containing protein [Streptomyces sp. WI04-05A]
MSTDAMSRTRLAATCLTDLLAEQTRLSPDRIAVVHEAESLTFSQLMDRGQELGAFLRQVGVTRGSRVGVFMEPSLDLMTTVWGILWAGGSYVPLSPEYPGERIAYMMADAGVEIVLTQELLRPALQELSPVGVRAVTLDEVFQSPEVNGNGMGGNEKKSSRGREAGEGEKKEEGKPGAEDLAYVIYTSGSTGKPKGVMVEHRSIVNQMRWLHTAQGIDAGEIILQKTPMSFDAAQWEILAPACGSTVVMGAPGVYRDPEAIIATIRRHGVTTLQCVPTLLQALLDTENLSACGSLRHIFSGGEALSRSLAAQCLDTMPTARLVNLYGPTECTINASAFVVDRAAVDDGPRTMPVGTPVSGTTFHILDPQGKPVAIGEIGELHVGGIQVARGYLGRPDLTADRFLDDPFSTTPGARLYRTGDLAHFNADSTVQFVGRADNQVKLRGYRVELDEIRQTIETHDWVRGAAVLLHDNDATGFQNLVAFVELNPKEAAVMDQGNHGSHHQSKRSRLQVRAQLAHSGCRDAAELDGRPVVELPGAEATSEQRARAFARKTYRFYEGGTVGRDDILRLLAPRPRPQHPARHLADLPRAELGALLRNFGRHVSDQRLLPKYAYASPGSLYATQLYLELDGVGGIPAGLYYYHPLHHHLVLVGPAHPDTDADADTGTGAGAGTGTGTHRAPRARVHFLGKHRAIEPVYRNNIREVLEIEAGHMVGLFEEILPAHGLGIAATEYLPSVKDRLDCAEEDHYLGTFELLPSDAAENSAGYDIYVQAHSGRVEGLPAGQYRYTDGSLVRISDDLVAKKHVIAINQRVHERAGFGVSLVATSPDSWRQYLDLGRKLQRLQMNDLGLGFMSSGYSSKSGNDLPSAKQLTRILTDCGLPTGPSYFFVGGRVSDEQLRGEDMKEDSVHMQGPAELIKEDLAGLLPRYMLPNRIVVLDRLPLTANGKIDNKALEASQQTELALSGRAFVAPRTRSERRVRDVWQTVLKREQVSVVDDFFELGGNSLLAVALVGRLNADFGQKMPLQVLFEAPTVEKLAARLDTETSAPLTRLVPLQPEGTGTPLHCWPGLGGYPMNLRPLATALGNDRPVHGVQAYGINSGEVPYATVREMATADVEAIREIQPHGPYLLCGYSFGARVAFEAAYQLEQAGELVEHLFLVAPGQPRLRPQDAQGAGHRADFGDRAFLAILFSVFAGTVSGPALDEALRTVRDEDGFVAFVTARFPGLSEELVRAVTGVVRQTYSFTYEFDELTGRRLDAPVTLVKATDDNYSFIERSERGGGFSTRPPAVHQLRAGHYELLREPYAAELAALLNARIDATTAATTAATTGLSTTITTVATGISAADVITSTRPGRPAHAVLQEVGVPHINIKHFPVPITDEQERELVTAVTAAVRNAFGCKEDVVSIALEPVTADVWNERVYVPEIVDRQDLLRKTPNY